MRHLPGAAWMKDAQGRYVYANETAERIFRTPLSALRGKTDEEVFSTATAAQFKANDRQAMTSGSYLETTETLSQEDGLHLSLVRKFPILDRAGRPILVGGVAFDVTERKQAEAILRESEERFRTLFDSAPIPIAVHEANGRILRTNRAYQRMLGYSDEELRQLGVKGITHPDDIAEGKRLFHELVEGKREHSEREKRYCRKDGRIVRAQSTASAVRGASGQLRYIISTVEDLTERTKAEQRHRAFSELGHRLSAAKRTARPGVAPTASRAAPQAHAPSPLKTARNACEVIIVPNRIASLRLIAPSLSRLLDHLIRPHRPRRQDRAKQVRSVQLHMSAAMYSR